MVATASATTAKRTAKKKPPPAAKPAGKKASAKAAPEPESKPEKKPPRKPRPDVPRAPRNADHERDMQIEWISLEQLQKWPKNPKLHDLEQINASMTRFGYVTPILVDETSGRLIAGHGRIETLETRKMRGEPPPARVKVDPETGEWYAPVIRGISFEDEAEARLFLLADNRLVEAGGWDAELLLPMIQDLDRETMMTAGFHDSDVERLLKQLDGDNEKQGRTVTFGDGEDADDKTLHICPRCNFKYRE
jgi:ParB-like chromosome segregation protein Spo0J